MHCQCEDIWLICIALVGLALHCFPSKCCSIARTIHRWSGCADTRIDSGVCPISPRHTGLVPNCAIQLLISTPICTNGDHRQQWGDLLHKSCTNRAHIVHICSDYLPDSADVQQFASCLFSLTWTIFHRPHVGNESQRINCYFSESGLQDIPGILENGTYKKIQGEAADAVWFRASDPSAPLSVVVVGGGAVNGTNQLNPPNNAPAPYTAIVILLLLGCSIERDN